MSTPPTIRLAFYPSPHGFGHFMRIVNLARLILQRNHHSPNPKYHIYIRTNVPSHIVDSLRHGWTDIDSYPLTFSKYTLPLQPAIVQTNPYTLSAGQTFDAVRAFDASAALAQEEAFVREKGVQVIVSDCPSIVCGIEGVPSILVTNFLFDAILQGLANLSTDETNHALDPAIQSHIHQMTAQYNRAAALLRLPGHIPMHYPSAKTLPIPFHFRRANASRSETLSTLSLSLPPTTKILLHCFGGQPQQQQTPSLPSLPPNWICLSQTLHAPPLFHKLDPNAYIPNLIAASDAVLGKLGWGMCSEVLGNGRVPFIYVPRPAFGEEVGLLAWMRGEHRRVVRMEVEAFEAGEWEGVVREVEGLAGERAREGVMEGAWREEEEVVGEVLEGVVGRLVGGKGLRGGEWVVGRLKRLCS